MVACNTSSKAFMGSDFLEKFDIRYTASENTVHYYQCKPVKNGFGVAFTGVRFICHLVVAGAFSRDWPI